MLAVSPRACSGDMYPGVPSTAPSSVSVPPSRGNATGRSPSRSGKPATLDKPQSSTYTSPKSPSMMLLGLRSRCSTPRECAKSTARHAAEKARSNFRRG